jgi:hypothetical protein
LSLDNGVHPKIPAVKTFGDILGLIYGSDKGQASQKLGLRLLSNVANGLFGATIGGDIEGQLPLYSGGKTQGILDIGTDELPLISGKNGPAADMPSNAPGMPESWAIRDHVEAHAAAVMRQLDVSEADLYINNTPCSGPMGCNANLPHMLPEGATLRVHIQNGVNNWEVRSYVGLPDSEWNWP